MFKRDSVPYLIGVAVVLVVVLVVRFFAGGSARALEARAAEQARQVTTLQNQIVTRQTELNQQKTTVSVDASALDAARVEKDGVLAREIVERVVTWSGREEYDEIRAAVTETYHLNDGDRFVKILVPSYGTRATNAGFAEDADVASEYVGSRTLVCDVVGDKYSYFMIVNTTLSSGDATVDVAFAVLYSVDGLGNLADLSAYNLT